MASSLFGPAATPPAAMTQAQQIKKLMTTLSPNQTPQQMLESLIKQNPQLNNLLSLLQQNNGDIRSLVTTLAQQKGVDLNALYEQYKAI